MTKGNHNYPSTQDLADSFVSAGLQDGDVVYLSTQLFGIGLLKDAFSRQEYLEAIYTALVSVIGSKGTLVVPTFTQQVGRFGYPFILEETESLTGIFGEYVRMRPDSIRSLHPVFSVSAIGPQAQAICSDISPVAFGKDSAFDRLIDLGAKAVCIGFDYYSGHIVSLMHLVETSFAVPYYYNKLICSSVYVNNSLIKKPFVINVKYLGMNCEFDFKQYIDRLEQKGEIRAAEIGRGFVYAVDAKVMFDEGISLLKTDVYSFLTQTPTFRKGEIPLDGPPNASELGETQNWAGFQLVK